MAEQTNSDHVSSGVTLLGLSSVKRITRGCFAVYLSSVFTKERALVNAPIIMIKTH